RTPLLPLLFLISCIAMGFAVVVFEAALSSMAFKRRPEIEMLSSLAAIIVPLQIVFVAIRIGDLWWQGNLDLLLAADTRAIMAALEFVLFVAPILMLASARSRRDLGALLRGAMVMMFAGAVYRFDSYLVAFTPGAN